MCILGIKICILYICNAYVLGNIFVMEAIWLGRIKKIEIKAQIAISPQKNAFMADYMHI